MAKGSVDQRRQTNTEKAKRRFEQSGAGKRYKWKEKYTALPIRELYDPFRRLLIEAFEATKEDVFIEAWRVLDSYGFPDKSLVPIKQLDAIRRWQTTSETVAALVWWLERQGITVGKQISEREFCEQAAANGLIEAPTFAAAIKRCQRALSARKEGRPAHGDTGIELLVGKLETDTGRTISSKTAQVCDVGWRADTPELRRAISDGNLVFLGKRRNTQPSHPVAHALVDVSETTLNERERDGAVARERLQQVLKAKPNHPLASWADRYLTGDRWLELFERRADRNRAGRVKESRFQVIFDAEPEIFELCVRIVRGMSASILREHEFPFADARPEFRFRLSETDLTKLRVPKKLPKKGALGKGDPQSTRHP
jgi:hypothetical protein